MLGAPSQCPYPLQKVPREIITLILRKYMHDFFSAPRDPVLDVPVTLHVCHLWRQVVINDPQLDPYQETDQGYTGSRNGQRVLYLRKGTTCRYHPVSGVLRRRATGAVHIQPYSLAF